LKVEYVEPFVEAARSVLERVANGPAQAGSLGLAGTTFSAASVNIAARISGILSGDVMYSMSNATAQKLAGAVTGSEARAFGRSMGQGLGQLGVMLARETTKILTERGLRCEISSPLVFQGLNVEFTVEEPALSVALATEAGQLSVNVAVSDDR
jgi:chemotaxis protein CheX